MTGLRAMIIYDDYSTQIVETSDLVLSSKYDKPLTKYSRYVEVTFGDMSLKVDVSVKEAPAEDSSNDSVVDSSIGESNAGENSGCGSITVTSAVVILALALVAVVLVNAKKQRKNRN